MQSRRQGALWYLQHRYVIPSERDRDRAERRPHKCGTRHTRRRGPSPELRM